MSDYETILYEEVDRVAWVTLNRPEVHNAFDAAMLDELERVWRELRSNDDVRCVVLTGAGDKAFCTGIDRMAAMGGGDSFVGSVGTPFMFDDPGDKLGPKSCGLWKPVIAAVNGMACGGAFYMLGEVDFIIAADHATFFDPHVTFGMASGFEPIHMLYKMPAHEILRLTLLGSHERMSAERAFQIGLVSEVVPAEELRERVEWAARAIASAPSLAVQGSLRAIWSAIEQQGRIDALRNAYAFIGLGNDEESLAEGQEAFASGQRIEWRLR